MRCLPGADLGRVRDSVGGGDAPSLLTTTVAPSRRPLVPAPSRPRRSAPAPVGRAAPCPARLRPALLSTTLLDENTTGVLVIGVPLLRDRLGLTYGEVGPMQRKLSPAAMWYPELALGIQPSATFAPGDGTLPLRTAYRRCTTPAGCCLEAKKCRLRSFSALATTRRDCRRRIPPGLPAGDRGW
jgi:hypothetical protein